MTKEEENKKSLLIKLKYRRHILRSKEIGLILLQIMGLVSCTLYVLSNFLSWSIGNFVINTKYYTFILRGEYLSSFCLVLSILLAIPRPANLRSKINELNTAIKLLIRKKKLSDWENNIINLASTYVKDIDIAYEKKISGKKDELEPHEKRMVLRKRLIVFGILGIIILTILLIGMFGCTFPQIVAIDMAIGYSMVIFESFYYQKELKKAHIYVMTDEHREIIEVNTIQEEQFKFFQKVFHMEADRYLNYCLVLGVASSILNILAILLSLLDASSNMDLKRLFAIESIDVNTEISIIFMVISIVFFILDIFLNSYFGQKIVELQAKKGMKYTIENYESLMEDWECKINSEDTFLSNVLGNRIAALIYKPFMPLNQIFSRNALDVGRGRYDYNNDSLVKNKNRIPAVCMSTVEDSFPGRVPRFKLTAFIIWLVLFCFLVWGRADIYNLIPISIVSIVLYDFIVMIFAVRTWNGMQTWISFEKELEKYIEIPLTREVKWDFLSYYLGHSIIIIILACTYIWGSERNIDLELLIGLAITLVLTSVIGYRFAKEKKLIQMPQVITTYGALILVGIGLINFLIEKNIDIFTLLVFLVIIPAFTEILASYYRRVKNSLEEIIIEIPACAICLIIVWCSNFLILYWHEDLQENYIGVLFKSLYIIFDVLVISGTVWGIKQMYD